MFVLVRANASAAEEDRLSDEEVFGQVAYVLFFKFRLLTTVSPS